MVYIAFLVFLNRGDPLSDCFGSFSFLYSIKYFCDFAQIEYLPLFDLIRLVPFCVNNVWISASPHYFMLWHLQRATHRSHWFPEDAPLLWYLPDTEENSWHYYKSGGTTSKCVGYESLEIYQCRAIHTHFTPCDFELRVHRWYIIDMIIDTIISLHIKNDWLLFINEKQHEKVNCLTFTLLLYGQVFFNSS